MLNLSHLEGELLPPPLPGWAPHRAVSAWLNMSIYTYLAPLMRANLPLIDFWHFRGILFLPVEAFNCLKDFICLSSPCRADLSAVLMLSVLLQISHRSARWPRQGGWGGSCLITASQKYWLLQQFWSHDSSTECSGPAAAAVWILSQLCRCFGEGRRSS